VPEGSLIAVHGKLYGTTQQGGANGACTSSSRGCGTVFTITPDGTESVLHTFGKGHDGISPSAALLDVQGTLYGTTSYGGAFHGHRLFGELGYGTVFSITTSGTEKVLHNFGKGIDGAFPIAGLIEVRGTMYGTTREGGASGRNTRGTVFSLTTDGTESVLHSFAGGNRRWRLSRSIPA
jgi:uncharacterized repeat protein (TIGR03803 family)